MMLNAVTDLPQPDSPTMPSVSPGFSSNETPSTALTVPSLVAKTVCRSWTSSSAWVTCAYLRRGSNASRIALPKMLDASTVMKIVTPGKMTSQNEWKK